MKSEELKIGGQRESQQKSEELNSLEGFTLVFHHVAHGSLGDHGFIFLKNTNRANRECGLKS